MEEDILKQLAVQEKKLDEIYRSVELIRKFFVWALIITVAFFVLPLVGLMFAIPQFLNIYNSANLFGL